MRVKFEVSYKDFSYRQQAEYEPGEVVELVREFFAFFKEVVETSEEIAENVHGLRRAWEEAEAEVLGA